MYLYKVGFWDAVGPMLIGMALVKRRVFAAARSYRFYATMAAVGYGIGLPINIWMVADWTRHGFAAGARWVSLDELTRMSIALRTSPRSCSSARRRRWKGCCCRSPPSAGWR